MLIKWMAKRDGHSSGSESSAGGSASQKRRSSSSEAMMSRMTTFVGKLSSGPDAHATNATSGAFGWVVHFYLVYNVIRSYCYPINIDSNPIQRSIPLFPHERI